MKRFILVSVLALCFASGCSGNKVVKGEPLPGSEPHAEDEWKAKTDISEKVQDKIIAKISMLQEFKEAERNIDAVSDHRSGVTSIIDRDENGRGYIVQVGYSGGERFETYYFFLVMKGSYEIRILDMTDDKYVPLDAWRRKSAK